jgi:hypothetical protein
MNDLGIPEYNTANTVFSERYVIEAPASIVWEILVDMERYGDWNPFCVKADSTLEIGAPVNMVLNNYTNPGELVPNCEYVCANVPERLLSWELPVENFEYAARRDQVIEALGPERCLYFTTDAFLGEHARHIMYFCGGWVKRAFDDSAKALKERAEAFHKARKN